MPKSPETEDFSDNEAAKRMENAIRKALNTPHRPHAEPKKARKGTKQRGGKNAKAR